MLSSEEVDAVFGILPVCVDVKDGARHTRAFVLSCDQRRESAYPRPFPMLLHVGRGGVLPK
jgi:hypothetical protein